jgi:hypothetical protein
MTPTLFLPACHGILNFSTNSAFPVPGSRQYTAVKPWPHRSTQFVLVPGNLIVPAGFAGARAFDLRWLSNVQERLGRHPVDMLYRSVDEFLSRWQV